MNLLEIILIKIKDSSVNEMNENCCPHDSYVFCIQQQNMYVVFPRIPVGTLQITLMMRESTALLILRYVTRTKEQMVELTIVCSIKG